MRLPAATLIAVSIFFFASTAAESQTSLDQILRDRDQKLRDRGCKLMYYPTCAFGCWICPGDAVPAGATEATGNSTASNATGILSRFYGNVIGAYNGAVNTGSTIAIFGRPPNLIYGPFTREDMSHLIDAFGETNSLTKAMALGMDVGELVAKLTAIKTDQSISLERRRLAELFVASRFACEKFSVATMESATPPGSEKEFCARLLSSTDQNTKDYVMEKIDRNVGLIRAYEVAVQQWNTRHR